jgi:hypothetical protein
MEAPKMPTLYCQMGFLEKFLDMCKPSLDELLFDTGSKAETITACFRLIFGTVNLKLDIESETLLKHPTPLVKKLWKKSTGNIYCQPSMALDLKSDEFWKRTSTEVFMLDVSDAEAEDLEKDWGMMVLTPSNIAKKARPLVTDSTIFAAKKDTNFNWNHFIEQKHCFHTALIVDNYLDGNIHRLRNNLVPLIKNICSKPPRKRILQIIIITTKDDYELLHNNLLHLLTEKHIPCELCVKKTETLENHDRHLITNQRWIFSGIGFMLLKWDNVNHCTYVKQSTTFLCMPLVSNAYIAYPREASRTELSSTHFTAIQGILGRLRQIDDKINDKIGISFGS